MCGNTTKSGVIDVEVFAMNLARNLERSAFYFPDRPAVREGELEITYQELNVPAAAG